MGMGIAKWHFYHFMRMCESLVYVSSMQLNTIEWFFEIWSIQTKFFTACIFIKYASMSSSFLTYKGCVKKSCENTHFALGHVLGLIKMQLTNFDAFSFPFCICSLILFLCCVDNVLQVFEIEPTNDKKLWLESIQL